MICRTAVDNCDLAHRNFDRLVASFYSQLPVALTDALQFTRLAAPHAAHRLVIEVEPGQAGRRIGRSVDRSRRRVPAGEFAIPSAVDEHDAGAADGTLVPNVAAVAVWID